jgi:tetratricopeptide (TPR) repeat protein
MSNRKPYGLVMLFACLGLWIAPGSILSQEAARDALDAAIKLYDQQQFKEAAQELSAMLKEYRTMGHPVLMEVYKYLAICHASLGGEKQEQSAKENFKRALRLNPDLFLEEAEYSPKITRVFGLARAELDNELRRERNAQLWRTTRVGAGLRSMVLPGWGQMYRGYKTRGWVLLGATFASGVALSLAERAYFDAQDQYDRAGQGADFRTLSADVEKKADAITTWGYVLAAAWTYTLLDALILNPNIQGVPEDMTAAPELLSLHASLYLGCDEVLLGVRVGF